LTFLLANLFTSRLLKGSHITMKLSLLVLLFPLLSLANPVAIPAPAPVPVPAAFEPAQPLAKRETALNAFLTVLL
jgi:hypothetical protein